MTDATAWKLVPVDVAAMTIPDEPCCHRIVALMDRCKGLLAEVERLKARESKGKTDMDEARLKEIEARANAATGGPWRSNGPLYTWIDALGCCERGNMHVFDVRGWGHLTGKGSGAHGMSEADGIAVQRANADFIAHARTDIPDLLRELTAAREEIGRLENIAADEIARAGALRAQLSTPEPSAVTVTDEMVERALAAWYPGEWPHDPAFSSTVGNELFADRSRKEMRAALTAAFAQPPHRTTGEGE